MQCFGFWGGCVWGVQDSGVKGFGIQGLGVHLWVFGVLCENLDIFLVTPHIGNLEVIR